MKLYNRRISKYFLVGALIVATGGGCTKSFDKMNIDPNTPVKVPGTNTLAYAIGYYGQNLYDMWGDMNEPECFGGHLGKIQYIDEARNVFRGVTIENLWTYHYRVLNNLQITIKDAVTNGKPNQQAAALTFKCFVAQIATDTWGDIPYSDAIKGNDGVIAPKYDKQKDIYTAILADLKTANDLFAKNSADELGSGDLLFSGDVGKWRKFCNSIRLRVAIRLSKVDPATAKANIEEIASSAVKFPVMTDNTDNAFLNWPGGKPYNEPWSSNKFDDSRDDHALSDILVNKLLELNDPRLPVYGKAGSDGKFRGVGIGIADNDRVSPLSLYSRIGARFRDNKQGFTPYMRVAEVKFILAEAAAKGWNVGVSAQQAYEDGIDKSLEENGVSNGGYKSSAGVKWDGDIKKIYIQKWIALFKDGHEAWAETRRTDVPLLPAATASPYPGHTRVAFHMPYPNSETTLNGGNSAAAVGAAKDNFWGNQMYWDTRTGVN
ncbi:SusD/RagB family nutrient-binding outer membrane lipoprotein [Chitinophaga polysaccharea]|uniref:SusD/RagB family nutrient-binding outer membrane lipoprotein n=1 Tax=Chitinophaga polysaccharea TaxID=1293035 RepID=UPI0014558B24|nr:SusD/RagB family nutrient-binding outer membrane lipoprotein [Chitinophaga polysaccharea]NLR60824.1 SusD/RagB family nutrient-binding outer membrane lipoprotein [Chitinophaga polysaccharea]